MTEGKIKLGPTRPQVDLDVYNESDGLVFLSRAFAGAVDSEERWSQAVAEGDLFPVGLVQDDPVLVRVILGPLGAEEQAQWVGRLIHQLRIPDGELIVAGGRHIAEEGLDNFTAQYAHRLELPPGDYRAALYATAHGINGGPLLERIDAPPLGRWWRETVPGEALAPWVQFECWIDPKQDPGFEREWAHEPDLPAEDRIDFVLQLEPLLGLPPTPPPTEEGFFDFEAWDVRIPKRCPAGLFAQDPVEIEIEDDEEDDLFDGEDEDDDD